MKPCHHDSMSESNGYYDKENESDRKRQTRSQTWNRKKENTQNENRPLDTANKQAVARGGPPQLCLGPDQILASLPCALPRAVLKTQICMLSPNPSASGWLSARAH